MARNAKHKNEIPPEDDAPVKEEAADQVSEPEIVETAEPTAEEMLAAANDRFLRLAAEYDNYRKRSQKERETLYAEIKAETAAKFLPVYDNVVRALGEQSGSGEDTKQLQVFDMLKRQLDSVFHNLGAQILSSETEVGKPFDPERHNAVLRVPAGENAPETVAFIVQSGIEAGGKIVKHADAGVYAADEA